PTTLGRTFATIVSRANPRGGGSRSALRCLGNAHPGLGARRRATTLRVAGCVRVVVRADTEGGENARRRRRAVPQRLSPGRYGAAQLDGQRRGLQRRRDERR